MLARTAVATAIIVLLAGITESRATHVNCQDLHAAAYLDEPAELELIIAHGANLECRDAVNQTPLITATDGASFSAFSILLIRGVNIHARDEIGQTALDKAREKVAFFDMKGGEPYRDLYREMIKMLIAAGADE